MLGSRSLRSPWLGESTKETMTEGTGKPDNILPLEFPPSVDRKPPNLTGSLDPWKPQSLGIGATVKSKVGLVPAECSSCLDLRSLPRTQSLGNALHPVQDRVSCRKQPYQRQSLPAFLPLWDMTPAHAHPTCPGPVLSTQSRWSNIARKRRFSPQVMLITF